MSKAKTPLTIQDVRYSDFSSDFAPHPVTRDLSLVNNDESIKQSLLTLFATKPYERLFQSNLSSPVYQYLFELSTPITVNLIHDAILELVDRFEKRINVLQLNIKEDGDYGYNIKMYYKSFESTQTKTFDFFLERVK